VLSARGFCEVPVPALVSPFLLEVYNSVAATAMGLRKLSGLEVMLGVQFAVLFGESYFAPDERVDRRVVKRARIVGFSNKAMEFGVTVPLPYVERANLALRGREEAAEYTSVIVETHRNEDVPGIVDDARVLGLTLSPRSEEGRKAANVLLVLTIVFAMVSLVILGISAINITHTFLMLVTERRAEIAVWRAVGATLLDVRLLVLGEALVLGLAGGAAGLAVAYGLSRAANAAASGVLAHVPGSPSDLFVFPPPVIAAGVACAVLFAVVGAWVPASRAARTDPATVLSQG
jgi:ABC-type antimicrobial peptide transport system permease subunit